MRQVTLGCRDLEWSGYHVSGCCGPCHNEPPPLSLIPVRPQANFHTRADGSVAYHAVNVDARVCCKAMAVAMFGMSRPDWARVLRRYRYGG